MNIYYYFFVISLIIIELIHLIRAEKSFYYIYDFKIKSLQYNESSIQFCSESQNNICVDNLNIIVDKEKGSFSNMNDENKFIVNADGAIEIDVSCRLFGNVSTENVKQKIYLESGSTTITFVFESQPLVVQFTFTVKCQKDYLGPKCSEVNLCSKVPPNMCRNNGTCTQNNGLLTCVCSPGFTGSFCDHINSSCQGNLCSKHSTCRQDENSTSKYRCECNEGYSGELCNNTCNNNFCNNNSTCKVNEAEKTGYTCECEKGFSGRFCDLRVDNCAKNTSLCSQYINATCFSTKHSHICYCEGGCITQSMTTQQPILSFKWPFSDFITFLFVLIEAMIILVLIVVIIIFKRASCGLRMKRHGTYLDENSMMVNGTKMDPECLEFGSNYSRQPMNLEELDNRHRSLNPVYDINDLTNFNSIMISDTPGMSTFGRR